MGSVVFAGPSSGPVMPEPTTEESSAVEMESEPDVPAAPKRQTRAEIVKRRD